ILVQQAKSTIQPHSDASEQAALVLEGDRVEQGRFEGIVFSPHIESKDDLIHILHREGPEKKRIDHAENRGIGAHSERQTQDDDCVVGLPAYQSPEGQADGLRYVVHKLPPPSISFNRAASRRTDGSAMIE